MHHRLAKHSTTSIHIEEVTWLEKNTKKLPVGADCRLQEPVISAEPVSWWASELQHVRTAEELIVARRGKKTKTNIAGWPTGRQHADSSRDPIDMVDSGVAEEA